MRMKNDMDDIEGEKVARPVKCNREWTRMDANLGERDRPGRCGARLAPRSEKKREERDVFGGTPNTAVDPSPLRFDATRTTALPTNRISKHSRLFESMRVSMRKSLISRIALRKSLISRIGLMQVVDFHVIFRYFQLFLACFYAKAWQATGWLPLKESGIIPSSRAIPGRPGGRFRRA
jgi:hypothetical protein